MESRRRRRPQPASNTVPARPESTKSDETNESNAEEENNEAQNSGNGFGVDIDGHDFGLGAIDPATPDNVSEGHVPHMIYQTQGERLSQDERVRRLSMSQPPVQFSPMPVQKTPQPKPTFSKSPSFQIPSPPKLPYFFKDLPSRIDTDDREYLAKKGALQVPPLGLRNELLRCFVQYVYPYSPLINLREFLFSVLRPDGRKGRVSLLLFQAIMFAGSAFVDFSHLRAVGFTTRRDARKAFFRRVRLLYDFDYEPDRVTMVQALLLLTNWYESPEDQKDTWHWMGVSISVAHTMGLHRDPSRSNLSSGHKSLLKRIWWSLVLRDRLIALGMRRPTRVQNSDYDVPMLNLDDFDTAPYPDEIVQGIGNCTMLRSQRQMTQLAVMCIESAKLCRPMNDVLSTQYSIQGTKSGGPNGSTITLVPRTEPSDLQACDFELENWYNSLAPDARYDPWEPPDDEGRILFLHRALLKTYYLTALSALHRPQVLSQNPILSLGYDNVERSRVQVRNAAIETTDIVQQLQSRDLVRFLPTAGVTVLLPAIIIHLLDIKSSDDAIRTASICRFCQCMQVLMRLREMYASADYATAVCRAILDTAMRKTDLPFPSLTQQPFSVPQSDSTVSPAAIPQSGVPTLTPPPENSLNLNAPNAPFSDRLDLLGDDPSLSNHAAPNLSQDHVAGVSTGAFDLSSTAAGGAGMGGATDHLDGTRAGTDFDQVMNVDFFDGLVMPASSETSDSRPGTAMGMTSSKDFDMLGNTSIAQGESSGFALDLDLMVDLKALDGVEW